MMMGMEIGMGMGIGMMMIGMEIWVEVVGRR